MVEFMLFQNLKDHNFKANNNGDNLLIENNLSYPQYSWDFKQIPNLGRKDQAQPIAFSGPNHTMRPSGVMFMHG